MFELGHKFGVKSLFPTTQTTDSEAATNESYESEYDDRYRSQITVTKSDSGSYDYLIVVKQHVIVITKGQMPGYTKTYWERIPGVFLADNGQDVWEFSNLKCQLKFEVSVSFEDNMRGVYRDQQKGDAFEKWEPVVATYTKSKAIPASYSPDEKSIRFTDTFPFSNRGPEGTLYHVNEFNLASEVGHYFGYIDRYMLDLDAKEAELPFSDQFRIVDGYLNTLMGTGNQKLKALEAFNFAQKILDHNAVKQQLKNDQPFSIRTVDQDVFREVLYKVGDKVEASGMTKEPVNGNWTYIQLESTGKESYIVEKATVGRLVLPGIRKLG